MASVRRVKPEEGRRRVQSGEALFVCAYDSEELCSRLRLEGSISMAGLQSRLPGISKDQEIIFYCQ